MGVPTKGALSGNRLNADAKHHARAKRAATRGATRANGLMFASEALERGAQDSIARANAADQAQRTASSSGVATEPYVVTRPKGRTVIVAKKDAVQFWDEPGSLDDESGDAKAGGMLATYNPSHPSVLFHRLKHGLLSRLEVLSLHKRLTAWLRKRTHKNQQVRRERRLARSGGSRLIRHRSGLIIPVPDQPFLLSETQEAMDDLMAENQRLKRLVDEIIRSSPANLARLQR